MAAAELLKGSFKHTHVSADMCSAQYGCGVFVRISSRILEDREHKGFLSG